MIDETELRRLLATDLEVTRVEDFEDFPDEEA